MSWIDVAIFGLVVLCGLFGLWRGVKKSAVTLGAFIVAFILAFFLANVVAEALLGIDGIKSFVLGDGVGEGSSWSLTSWLYEKMPESPDLWIVDAEGEAKDPSFLYKNFYEPILKIVGDGGNTLKGVYGEGAPAVGAAMYGAFLIFSAICGVGIFIIARFLFVIVVVIINTYIGKKKTVMQRLFGFAVGAVRGAVWALAAMVVFSCFGGYTCFSGIANVQKEFENNAVVCQYFYEGAYGMRNTMFLPDADTYGRLVNMVYKRDDNAEPSGDTLPLARLELWLNVSNLNYDGNPWGMDANRKRTFDEQNAIERNASEFASVNFDTVVQAILDYNKNVADKLDDKTYLPELDYAMYNSFVKTGSNSIDSLITQLWSNLNTYATDYMRYTTEQGLHETLPERNSTLKTDYDRVTQTLDTLRAKYVSEMSEAFGALPEWNYPAQIVLTEDSVVTE